MPNIETREEKVKTKKELVQTYLIIITLLVTIKQAIISNQAIDTLETTLTYYAFFGFVGSTLLYYTRLTPKKEIIPKRDAIEFNEFVTDVIGISFGSVLYLCLSEQIIKTAKDTLDLFNYTLLQVIPVIALAVLTKEAFDCQDENLSTASLARIIVAILIVAIIIGFKQMNHLKP